MSRPDRSGRPAARNAALKRTAAGSGPHEARVRTGTGLDFDIGTEGQVIMATCRFIDRRWLGMHTTVNP